MRLQTYIINEEKSFNEWSPIIKKDCAKFIKDIRGSKGTFTRVDGYIGGRKRQNPVILKNTRSKRQVMDSPKTITNGMNKLFKEKFGWKARTENVVFCWGTPFNSQDINYGFLVFPVGNYKYVWSPEVRDLYGEFVQSSIDSSIEKEERGKQFMDFIGDEISDTYINKNLKKAVVSSNEIMVNCKQYYYIRIELIERVDQEFNLNWQGAKFTGRKII